MTASILRGRRILLGVTGGVAAYKAKNYQEAVNQFRDSQRQKGDGS